MFSSYRAVFERAGARSLALSCGLGWVSFASYGLALVLAIEAATGSFATAGGAVAAFSAGSALFAPGRGRVVDRYGPRALPYFAAVHGSGLACVVFGCLWFPREGPLLVLASGFAGVFVPPLIATARAVWPQVTGPGLARTGHAINAALGDAGQVVGPVVTAAVAVLASPVVALAVIVPGVVAGSLLLALTAPSAGPSGFERPSHRLLGVLADSAGLRVVVVCELMLGVSFGALEVAAPVVAADAGAAELAALPLAAFAASSVGVSLWSGTDRLKTPAAWRYTTGCVIVAAVLLLCLVTTTLLGVTLVLIGAGVGYGLLNVAVFELFEDLVERERAVEAFTWLTTLSGAGLAAGAAIAGQLSAGGPARTLLAVALPSALAAGVALARRSALAPTAVA